MPLIFFLRRLNITVKECFLAYYYIASCAASCKSNTSSEGEGGDVDSIAIDNDQLDTLVECRQCAVDSIVEGLRMNCCQEDRRLARFASRPEVTWRRCACSRQHGVRALVKP